MKILFWLSIGLDRRSPSEHLLTAMIERLSEAEHEVYVLQKATGGPNPNLPSGMYKNGVKTVCIGSKIPAKSNFVARYLSDIKYVLKCNKFLKYNKFDRVFLQSSNVAGFQCGLLKKTQPRTPVTFNIQDIFPENAVYSHQISKTGFIYKILSIEQRYAYQYAKRLVTISEDMKEELITIGADREKISVIYNWSYQDEMYEPEQFEDEIVNNLFSENTFNVVYAGNIGLMQNVDIVIKAAQQLKDRQDIQFHIIGEGLYRSQLEREVAEKQLSNVKFHEMLSADHAPAIYCKADVNIVPLAKDVYKTALPSKTATCLASGRPMILAIGRDSLLGKKIHAETGAPLLDSDDVEGLVSAVIGFKEKVFSYESKNCFLSHFQMRMNSSNYAALISGE